MKRGLGLLGCAIAVVAFLFVLAGAFWVGSRLATLSFGGGAAAQERQAEPSGRVLPSDDDGPRRHGVMGIVLRVQADSLVVRGRYGKERTVYVSGETAIERGRQHISVQDIRTGERVIVIGSPRPDGNIDARLVRVADPRKEPGPDRD